MVLHKLNLAAGAVICHYTSLNPRFGQRKTYWADSCLGQITRLMIWYLEHAKLRVLSICTATCTRICAEHTANGTELRHAGRQPAHLW